MIPGLHQISKVGFGSIYSAKRFCLPHAEASYGEITPRGLHLVQRMIDRLGNVVANDIDCPRFEEDPPYGFRKRRYLCDGDSTFDKSSLPRIAGTSSSFTTFSITNRTSLEREIPRSFAAFCRYSTSKGITTFLMATTCPMLFVCSRFLTSKVGENWKAL
ncbi:hypothetical protein IVA96_20240 [Bradyrhizobium sp. 159]|uniref:hypothetical protein n=1 Tax=Bradyrhizobium sp. 159 TaxID=2782632 RepID=UPI001FFBA161|nr:hypothetical protein [Bradyrhizobium sp. 159]MCK1618922.1 hypothetical protein [Bradyrhizobium sp. 159]